MIERGFFSKSAVHAILSAYRDASSGDAIGSSSNAASTIVDDPDAGHAVISAAAADAVTIEAGAADDTLLTSPLWPQEAPDWWQVGWSRCQAALEVDPAYAFWLRWYQAVLDGAPQNWEMLREIALIAPEDWDAGPERVAERIAEIEARYLSDATRLAERVDVNPETGLLRVTPIEVEDTPLVSALLGHVETILDGALAVPANGLREASFVPRLIRTTITRHANDPQRVEMSMVTAAKSLRREIRETEELPKSEENLALLDAVEETARGVRSAHPEVAAARERLARQALNELPEGDKAKLEVWRPILVDTSGGQMRDDYTADISALIADRDLPPMGDAPPLLAVDDAAARIFSRAAASWELLRIADEALEGISVRTGMKKHEILGTLMGVISLGLSIYGVL